MNKELRPKARVAKGFRDISADEIRGTRQMLATIQQVYEAYGFEPVEQPFIEYTDALGKFLPDQDRPNAGVFSFQDDDEQWLSLRYDLTAPLARYVAENSQKIPTPYRSYRQGWVFRNEKPGPGRFRQFMQFDADTVGSASPVADAEVCMMAADTMEALGLERGQYVMKVSNRKILDGLLDAISADGVIDEARRLVVLRAADKLDRLKAQGVFDLLTEGRKDESGDFTPGAKLSNVQADNVMRFLGYTFTAGKGYQADVITRPGVSTNDIWLKWLQENVNIGKKGEQGLSELKQMADLIESAGYSDRVKIDPTVVRGLEYYTGPVFECELLME
ncbi:HisS family protein, partial [Aestuariivirga sp.]|uniref:HisS family protein n=1 Tax=Aestuariivirga sp. TaxID=2650926 RepID=UPI00301A4266